MSRSWVLGERHAAVLRAAAAVLLASSLAACTGPAGRSAGGSAGVQVPATPPAGEPVGAAASRSRAAELEAGLTAVLVERAYVLARARAAGTPAAVAALDDSSLALADVLGAARTEARTPLLTALRSCDRRLVGPPAGARRPAQERSVSDCSARLTAEILRLVPRLAPEQLAGRLVPDVTDPAQGDAAALRAPAGLARGTARLLAGALAQDRGLEASSTPAATLRADLTWLLVEHMSLAVAAATASGEAGVPDEATVRGALSANGSDLAAVLGRFHPSAQVPAERTWNAHLDRLATWTGALRRGEVVRAATLRPSVAGVSGELSRLLARQVSGLPPARTDQELRPAVLGMLRAVEAAVQRRPTAPALLQRAVAEAPAAAALVAGAVAEDRRLA